MPDPKPTLPPIVPRWLSFVRAFRFVANPIPILDDNLRKYGSSYTFHVGGVEKGIVTVEPEIIQHVLQKNHRNYRKSKLQTDILAQYVGQGLLTSEGAFWLRQRRLIQPGFHRERLAKLVDLMNQEIADFVSALQSRIEVEPKVNMYAEMHRLAFRIVAKTIFSTSLSEERLVELSDLITTIQSFVIRLIRQPYLRPWFRWSGQVKAHKRLARRTRGVLMELISHRLRSGMQKDDLLQMLIEARYEDTGEMMNLEQLLDECLILFVAGHETSANALTWTSYLLSQHPVYVQRLREELVVQPSPITFEGLPELQLTRQVIEEAMRLYPPAWVIDRVAKEGDQCQGVLIPKNSLVILYIYGAHHNPKIWEDPETFRPERFGNERDEQVPAFAYVPFGGGPRLCIGNNFAMMEMQLILCHLVRYFDFQLSKDQNIELMPMITLRPKSGIWFDVQAI